MIEKKKITDELSQGIENLLADFSKKYPGKYIETVEIRALKYLRGPKAEIEYRTTMGDIICLGYVEDENNI